MDKLFWPVVFILALCSVFGMAWATYQLRQPDAFIIEGPVPTEFCWNKVVESEENGLHWTDGCNTSDTDGDAFCAQVITKLNQDQVAEYQGWIRVGKPELIGC